MGVQHSTNVPLLSSRCAVIDREIADAAISAIDSEIEADPQGKISSADFMGRLSRMDPAYSKHLRKVGADFEDETPTPLSTLAQHWRNYLESCDSPDIIRNSPPRDPDPESPLTKSKTVSQAPAPAEKNSPVQRSRIDELPARQIEKKMTNRGWMGESRQQVETAIHEAAGFKSEFEKQMRTLAPGQPKEALALLRDQSGYTAHADPAGGFTMVKTVDDMLGEVKTLKAQASTLITQLNSAYEGKKGPEILRIQSKLLPVLQELRVNYANLGIFAQAAYDNLEWSQ